MTLTALGLSPALLQNLYGNPGAPQSPDDLIVPEEVLKRGVKILMAQGADFGDIFVEQAGNEAISSDDRKINTSTRIEKGVGIRAVKGGRTFYAYTASFLPEKIFETARFVADAAASGGSETFPSVVNLNRISSDLSFPITPDPGSVPVKNKIELIQILTDRAWSADQRVTQVSQYFREIIRHVNLATSSGKLINQTLGLTEIYASTYMKDKSGNLQVGGDSIAAYGGRDFFKGEYSFESIVDNSVKRASKLLEAVDSPRGIFPVVLGPGDNGVLFHESCGHGMEADLVFKGSNYKDQLGKQTAAKGVTLIDDGTIPFMPGSFAFDDEGTPSQRTVLIKDGIQQNYLCDLIWAQKMGLKSTGNCSRGGYQSQGRIDCTNLYVQSGKIKTETIISSLDKGFYLKDAIGLHAGIDFTSGDFSIPVAGFMIEQGKISYPVRGISIGGNLFDFLKSVDNIGDDLTWVQSIGCPTFSVSNIKIGGAGKTG